MVMEDEFEMLKIKTMKIYKLLKTSFLAFLLVGFVFACNKTDDQNNDSIPPGKVSNVSVEPTNGGAFVTYDLPDDEDVLFVKASYTNTLGEDVFKVSSYYKNQIEIDGYNDTLKHELHIVAVDRSQNNSEPVVVEFKPLKSHIELVKESIEMVPDFGGIMMTWENPAEKQVYTHFSYDDTLGNTIVHFLSSDLKEEKFVIRGMDTTRKEFFVQVEDFFGNKTEQVSKGELSPLFEEKIDKSSWTLVTNMSVDGNAWEGRTVNVWDDVIDTQGNNSDNSYAMIWRNRNGGQLNYPLDIVIDINDTIIVNRLQVWQRAFWYQNESEYFYYQNENFKAFNIYSSNDKVNWTLLGEFSLEDPKDEDGNVPAKAIQEAIDGHNFELEQFSEPFRYLKFSITENFGSEEYVNISELTLYGTYYDGDNN
jgi:hypothetical protein